jgi:HEAT repeat protein
MHDSKDNDQANRSVLAFVKIGPVATPSLSALLADSSPDTRVRAAQALAMIRPNTPMVISRLRALF